MLTRCMQDFKQLLSAFIMNQYGAGGENPFNSYYVKQAGGGMPYFSGMRSQRGHGWFTRFLSNMVVPAMKTLGQRALVTGANIGSDILEGKDPIEATKHNLENEGKNLARAVIKRARGVAQSGTGTRGRCRRRKEGVKKTPRRNKRGTRKQELNKLSFLQ